LLRYPRSIPVWTLTLWANYGVALSSGAWNPHMSTSFTFVSFKGYSTHLIASTHIIYIV
jgi:hypothetical protein